MAKTQPGIGRGLSAILAVAPEPQPSEEAIREIPVAAIDPNPAQPRRQFDADALAALATSLQRSGVLQPVLVRPRADGRFELIAGERRWRAASIAGLAGIPAVIRDRSDAEAIELALVENMVREDLNPIEQARACAALVEELGLTREDVGLRVGRSRVSVSNLIRLLDLPDEVIALVEAGKLTEGHGRAVLLAEDHERRRAVAREAVARGLSVRATEELARRGSPEPKRRSAISGEHDRVAVEFGARLAAATGLKAAVRPRGDLGFRATIDCASSAELERLIAAFRRLG